MFWMLRGVSSYWSRSQSSRSLLSRHVLHVCCLRKTTSHGRSSNVTLYNVDITYKLIYIRTLIGECRTELRLWNDLFSMIYIKQITVLSLCRCWVKLFLKLLRAMWRTFKLFIYNAKTTKTVSGFSLCRLSMLEETFINI